MSWHALVFVGRFGPDIPVGKVRARIRRTIKGESPTEIAKSVNVSHTMIMRVMERNAGPTLKKTKLTRQPFKFATIGVSERSGTRRVLSA